MLNFSFPSQLISTMNMQKTMNQAKPISVLAGVGLAMTLSNPFDMIRIRMQTMSEMVEMGALKKSYSGIMDCMRRMVQEEGIRAFWKGNCANLLRFYGSQTINFLSKESIKKTLHRQLKINEGDSKFQINFLSGILGSWLALSFLYPIQHARNHISVSTSTKSKPIIGTILGTLKNQGFQALYRGSSISLFGVAVFRGTYFGIFDTFKEDKIGFERWFVAYYASLMAILLTYPTDTVRRRLMCSGNKKQKYSGFTDCSYKLYQKEGMRTFYRGAPIIFFQSLTSSCILYAYDHISKDLCLVKNSNNLLHHSQ